MPKNSYITANLYVGSAPYEKAPIDCAKVLVLCAEEYQPPDSSFYGTTVLRCPIPDAKLTPAQLKLVKRTALEVAQHLQNNTAVLCTCLMGLNRSALVAGLALRKLGFSGEDTLTMIRKYRSPNALFNKTFEKLVREMRVRTVPLPKG